MTNQAAQSYEASLATVQEFLRTPPEEFNVTSYDQYQAVVHESGLVEAIGALMQRHPATQLVDNQLRVFRHKVDGFSLSAVAESSDLMQTIRSKQNVPFKHTIRHNIQLFKGALSDVGDVAARNIGYDESMAFTRDGRMSSPRSTEELNRVLAYSQVAIGQFVLLVTT